MGTNFFFSTKHKEITDLFSTAEYELTERPDLHYEIHLAKTSAGWLPLFEEHALLHSVADIKKFYDVFAPKITIIDEYGQTYNWNEFEERVLKFNGGVVGAMAKFPIVNEPDDKWYDPRLPEYGPVSHFEYRMTFDERQTFFKDPEGYEFCSKSFR